MQENEINIRVVKTKKKGSFQEKLWSK